MSRILLWHFSVQWILFNLVLQWRRNLLWLCISMSLSFCLSLSGSVYPSVTLHPCISLCFSVSLFLSAVVHLSNFALKISIRTNGAVVNLIHERCLLPGVSLIRHGWEHLVIPSSNPSLLSPSSNYSLSIIVGRPMKRQLQLVFRSGSFAKQSTSIIYVALGAVLSIVPVAYVCISRTSSE